MGSNEKRYAELDRQYDYAVDKIKSALFDIINSQASHALEISLQTRSLNDPEKVSAMNALVDRIYAKIKHLGDVSAEVEETLQELESYSLDYSKLTSKEIRELIDSVEDQSVYSSEHKEVVNEGSSQESEILAESKEVEVPKTEDQSASKSITSNVEEPVVPVIDIPVKPEEVVVDVVAEKPKQNSDAVLISVPEEKKEEVSKAVESSNLEKPSEDKHVLVTDHSPEDEKQEVPVSNVSSVSSVPETVSEVVSESADLSSPMREEEKPLDLSATGEENLVFERSNDDPVKAILVTREQFSRLANSRITQEALAKVKQRVQSGSNDVKNSETYSDMESMLTTAKMLYDQGKTEEAQAMYQKISEINKAQKENQTSVVYTKAA